MLREKIVRDGILGNWDLAPSLAGLTSCSAPMRPNTRAVLEGTWRRNFSRTIPAEQNAFPRYCRWSLAVVRQAPARRPLPAVAGGRTMRTANSARLRVFNTPGGCLTLLEEGTVDRVAVVDLDVHQGDGNAALLTGHSGTFVLSLHGEKNFPFRKVPSDLDVGLPDGTDDRSYLRALADALDAVGAFRPDLVLYLSGVDPLRSDTLGRLDLTFEGLMERDRTVFEFCRRRGIPVSIAIGGGYADPITDSVEAYANTFRVARDVFRG